MSTHLYSEAFCTYHPNHQKRTLPICEPLQGLSKKPKGACTSPWSSTPATLQNEQLENMPPNTLKGVTNANSTTTITTTSLEGSKGIQLSPRSSKSSLDYLNTPQPVASEVVLTCNKAVFTNLSPSPKASIADSLRIEDVKTEDRIVSSHFPLLANPAVDIISIILIPDRSRYFSRDYGIDNHHNDFWSGTSYEQRATHVDRLHPGPYFISFKRLPDVHRTLIMHYMGLMCDRMYVIPCSGSRCSRCFSSVVCVESGNAVQHGRKTCRKCTYERAVCENVGGTAGRGEEVKREADRGEGECCSDASGTSSSDAREIGKREAENVCGNSGVAHSNACYENCSSVMKEPTCDVEELPTASRVVNTHRPVAFPLNSQSMATFSITGLLFDRFMKIVKEHDRSFFAFPTQHVLFPFHTRAIFTSSEGMVALNYFIALCCLALADRHEALRTVDYDSLFETSRLLGIGEAFALRNSCMLSIPEMQQLESKIAHALNCQIGLATPSILAENLMSLVDGKNGKKTRNSGTKMCEQALEAHLLLRLASIYSNIGLCFKPSVQATAAAQIASRGNLKVTYSGNLTRNASGSLFLNDLESCKQSMMSQLVRLFQGFTKKKDSRASMLNRLSDHEIDIAKWLSSLEFGVEDFLPRIVARYQSCLAAVR